MKKVEVVLLFVLTVAIAGCAETPQSTRVAVTPVSTVPAAQAEFPANLWKWREGLKAEEYRKDMRDCLFIVYGVEVANHNDSDKLVAVLFSYATSKGYEKRQWALAMELLMTECDLAVETHKNKKLTQQKQALPLQSK